MKNFGFYFMEKICFNSVLRKEFFFLVSSYRFKETKDTRFVINDWLKRGVVYTNGEIVISIGDDIREQRFIIILYKVRENYSIPYNDKGSYFTLEHYLSENGKKVQLERYENEKELYKNIINNVRYLKENLINIEAVLTGRSH